jgi:Zn-dependent membrane protease YugP
MNKFIGVMIIIVVIAFTLALIFQKDTKVSSRYDKYICNCK